MQIMCVNPNDGYGKRPIMNFKKMEMFKKSKIDILNGDLNKVIWIVIIPVIITNLIDGLFGVIDQLFITNVGSNATASVAFVGPIQDTLNAIGTGLTIAGASLIAKFIGSSEEGKASKMTGQLISIGVAIGMFVSLFTFVMSDWILLRSGITEILLQDATLYLKITSWATMLNFIIIIYLAIERAKGNTKKASSINIWSLILKIVFCYIFTIVFDFKIVGIGVSTLLSKGVCAIICIYEMVTRKDDRPITAKSLGIDMKLSTLLIITALPLIIEKSVVSYGFVIVNKYVLAFGEPVLAAYGITNKINSVFFKMVSAFGTGLSVIVAQNVGAGNVKRAYQAIRKSIIYSTILAVVIVLVIVPMPIRTVIAGMFSSPDEPTYQHILNAMGIYSAAVIPWAITETAMGIFQGTGFTFYNLIVSFVRIYILRVPVVMFFANLEHVFIDYGLGGEYGIWIAMMVSNILSAIFSFSLFLIVRKKLFAIRKNNDEVVVENASSIDELEVSEDENNLTKEE